MKRKLIVFAIAVLSCVQLVAQPALYGVLTEGGSSNAGTLVKLDAATNTLLVKHNFSQAAGAEPYGTLLSATNGMLYGTTSEGGSLGYGTLFQYNPQTQVLTTKANFDYDNTGAYNFGQLIQLASGEIVGVSSSGGVNGYGTIWKYNVSNNQLAKLKDLDDATGAFPSTGVYQASNGKLYGVTTNYGAGDFGTLYEYDLITNSFNILESFDYSNGAYGLAQLVEVNEKLIGLTYFGGAGDAGTIFEYDLNTTLFATRYNFDYGSNGGMPYGGGLNLASNGLLYGTTSDGGQNGVGTLFSYNPQTGDFVKIHDFNTEVGGPSYCPVTQASDGYLYGMTYRSNNNGVYDHGSIYRFDIDANVFTAIKNFDENTGGKPSWTGFSEIQAVTPPNCSPSGINAGSIAFNGSFNPNVPNTVSSVAPATPASGQAPVEYIWLKSLVNVPNTIGNPHWSVVSGSQNQVELTLNPLLETTYFIRCSRIQGCEMYWGETNIVKVSVDLCHPSYINSGSIAFAGSYNPNQTNIVTNVQQGSSDFGEDVNIEYIWLKSPVNVPNTVGNPHWKVVPGSQNQLSLTISGLVSTTYFIRCARAESCTKYWGETNIVQVPVDLCHPNYINSGSIAFAGSYNPNQTNIVTNVQAGSSDFGEEVNVEYIWLKSPVNVPNIVGNPHWKVVPESQNQLSLTIDGLVSTTYFIRCARAESCDKYWGETNIVEVPVDLCHPNYINSGSIAFEGSYNPNHTNIVTNVETGSSDFGEEINIEYIWLKSNVNTPNIVGNPHWTVVDGSQNQLALTLGELASTTYFIRCARAEGCEMYWGETNIVEVPVELCHPNYINSGSIAFDGSYNPNHINIVSNVEAGSSEFGEDVNIEYIWLQSNVNTPNIVGNPHWTVVEGSTNQLALTLSGLVNTTYFIRCARAEGCEMYWGETNIVEVPVDLCHPNYINSGSIAFDGSYNPNHTNIVTNVEAGNSDFGEDVNIEYIWLKSNINTPNTSGNTHWAVVEGSQNQLALTLSGLVSTTYFIRCARAEGCIKYWGETNIVEVPIDLCLPDFINGGSVSFSGPYNPNTTYLITSTTSATSDFGNDIDVEYIWLSNDEDVPFNNGNNGWEIIEGSTNSSYTIGALMETTYFIRCARVDGCIVYYGESNTVEVTVDKCLSDFINGGSVSFSGPYNPNSENVITNEVNATSDFGSNINIEYIWLANDEDEPFNNGNNGWEVIEGSANTSYAIGALTETTYFIRCARVDGCIVYYGESNIVEVTVDKCNPDFFHGGEIAFSSTYNPNANNVITNEVSATSDFGNNVEIQYNWWSNHDGNGADGWELIEGATGTSYTLPLITATTYFIRKARVAGCNEFMAISNSVAVEVYPCASDYFVSGGISFEQGEFDSNGTNIITSELVASSPYGVVVYAWAKNSTDSDVVIGEGNWTLVSGATSEELEIETITAVTYFVRLSRLDGCDDYVGISNIVSLSPGQPEQNGGSAGHGNFNCYPNPSVAGHATSVEFYNDDNSEMEVRVYSINGTQSKYGRYNLKKGEKNIVSVSLEGLTSGLYYMEIRKGDKKELKRLMVR